MEQLSVSGGILRTHGVGTEKRHGSFVWVGSSLLYIKGRDFPVLVNLGSSSLLHSMDVLLLDLVWGKVAPTGVIAIQMKVSKDSVPQPCWHWLHPLHVQIPPSPTLTLSTP